MKQVIVIRKDLNMRKGKIVAQGAHASMAAITNRGTVQPNSDQLIINLTPEMKEWLQGLFTKICVSVNSEEELLAVYNQANDLKLPCALIQDAGLTEFDGVPTYTAVAIGPDNEDIINIITGDLKLL